jgi:hypothetical protein
MHVYYEQKLKEIQSQIDGFLFIGQPILSEHHGNDFANRVLQDMRENSAALINGLPYIGGDANRLTANLIRTTAALSLHQSMKKHGKTAEDTARICYEVLEYAYNNNFIPVEKMTNDSQLVAKIIEQEKEFARFLQKREYPENWVYEFVPRTGHDFDYGRDYKECGIIKLLKRHNAGDLATYMCLIDYPAFRAQCIGLRRTKTLAIDNLPCDYRFVLGSGEIKLDPFSEATLTRWGKLPPI